MDEAGHLPAIILIGDELQDRISHLVRSITDVNDCMSGDTCCWYHGVRSENEGQKPTSSYNGKALLILNTT